MDSRDKENLAKAVASMRRIVVAPEPTGNVINFSGGLVGHRRPTLSQLNELCTIPGFEWVVDDNGLASMRPAPEN